LKTEKKANIILQKIFRDFGLINNKNEILKCVVIGEGYLTKRFGNNGLFGFNVMS
jgi:hypothetical protein